MSFFQIMSIVLVMIVILGYCNHRYFKLPDSIGVTVIGLALSVLLFLLGEINASIETLAIQIIHDIDFHEIVFHGFLGFLLFAGALHTDANFLKKYAAQITILSTLSVCISTLTIGLALYHGIQWLEAQHFISFSANIMSCLMFGALISPTDPIAVLALIKRHPISESLKAKISGESLFNDGTGVVGFMVFSGLATTYASPSFSDQDVIQWGSVVISLSREILGGMFIGLILGGGSLYLLKRMSNDALEIMLTLSVASSGYALAELIHVSAPIAVVVAGIIIGTYGPQYAFSQSTCDHLFSFWELLDELLNLLLFGLIGLQLLSIQLSTEHLWVSLLMIPVALLGRFSSIVIPVLAFLPFKRYDPYSISIMTWGGLRGSISIAMALSIPVSLAEKSFWVAGTYGVVVFSLLVQALTLGKLLDKANQKDWAFL